MAPRRRPSEPELVVRRAPFSENPRVGPRGQQTQQRILDAALQVFGDHGYHQGSIDWIAKHAGCSRVSFYQYFSSKEDVFRHLAGQVVRQLHASAEMLAPITPDREGWAALRAWIGRSGEIYDRYEPVFRAYPVASEDEAVAAAAARVGQRHLAQVRSRLSAMTLPPRRLDPLLLLLLEAVTETFTVASILRAAAPTAYPKDRVEVAATDVMHRTLFGLEATVNVHAAAGERPPALTAGAVTRGRLDQEGTPDATVAGKPALAALMSSGRDVFVSRGYHGTRVDDLVDAAGVSHGAFYRYFDSKEQLARMLTARALQTVSTAFVAMPITAVQDGATGKAALRRWLRTFTTTQADELAMVRVWMDAALEETPLRLERAPAYDWGRRRLARFLRPRGFGDADMEAIVMAALLSVLGTRRPTPRTIEAATDIIERGLLGR